MSATAEKGKTKEAEGTPRTKTRYIVLQVTDEAVVPIGEGEGLNDIAAIGEVAGAKDITEGDFVAVPARSWRVRSIAVQTKRSVSIR